MITEKEHHLITAMMLLEFAMQSETVPLEKCGLAEFGVLGLVQAAHSFVQAASAFGKHPDEYAKSVLAKIQADTAIENAIYQAKS